MFIKKLIFLLAVIIVSCNTGVTTKDNLQDLTADSAQKSTAQNNTRFDFLSGCYQNVLNGDTAFLKMNVHEFVVDGTLNYKRSEKDSNEGTFTGVIRGEIIIIHYVFQSEGTTSMREIAFKIKGNQLVEGYGDILMKGDSAVFENVASLKFQDAQTFNKIACP